MCTPRYPRCTSVVGERVRCSFVRHTLEVPPLLEPVGEFNTPGHVNIMPWKEYSFNGMSWPITSTGKQHSFNGLPRGTLPAYQPGSRYTAASNGQHSLWRQRRGLGPLHPGPGSYLRPDRKGTQCPRSLFRSRVAQSAGEI